MDSMNTDDYYYMEHTYPDEGYAPPRGKRTHMWDAPSDVLYTPLEARFGARS